MAEKHEKMTDVEAAKMAIAIEQDGFELYSNAAEKAANPDVKATLATLAHAEAIHKSKFEGIEARLLVLENAPYWDDEQITPYIHALADPKLFPPMPQDLQDTRSVLLYALQVERNSVLFYDVTANNAKDGDAGRIFDEIKDEEVKHVVQVTDALRALDPDRLV